MTTFGQKSYIKFYIPALILSLLTFNLFATGVLAQASNPRVIAQAKTNIRELPRTGLPMAALGLAALLPGGLILKKLMKKNQQSFSGNKDDDSANSIWNNRQSSR